MGVPNIDTSTAKEPRHRIPHPSGSGYLDRTTYRSVHFHGARLADPLAEAAHYLRQMEELADRPPHVLCVHEQFSWEDDGSDLAWQVTLVLGERVNESA